jgi:5-enolpyruvylshikimate-3-phosphate synthase
VLAAATAFAPSVSTLGGLHTLPHKESDRLDGCIKLVEWLGARPEMLDGSILRIHGRKRGQTGSKDPMAPFDPQGDHRMAFAAAIGAMRLGGTILSPSCVNKSFPGFWEVGVMG